MKAYFYVSNAGIYLCWIWLGLGENCTVCAKPGNKENGKKLCDNLQLLMYFLVYAKKHYKSQIILENYILLFSCIHNNLIDKLLCAKWDR